MLFDCIIKPLVGIVQSLCRVSNAKRRNTLSHCRRRSLAPSRPIIPRSFIVLLGHWF
ncbi:hypothetical protein BKA56DRAFT_582719 [Ilyonectria sp. MPI-CAGE-AT-0026]|nr:hypothetical protein BKA56DRAFT_582719 [Ilyonectria sp. MPI-CAGE-AT-0026]